MRRGVCALALAAALGAVPAPAAATGGSFALCYERLKQLAALYMAQGARDLSIAEPVDAPDQRRYVLEMRIGAATHRFACTRGGAIERVGEDAPAAR